MSTSAGNSAVAVALVLAFSAGVQGCGQCSGVLSCVESRHSAVDGQVLDANTGQPVPGTRLTLVGPSAAQAPDSSQATADAQGLFHLQLPVTNPADSIWTLRVLAPGFPGYTIRSFACRSTTVAGDGCELGSIVANPWFPLTMLFVYRGSFAPATALPVVFQRTGGSTLLGLASGTYQGTTDANTGGLLLFGLGIFASDYVPVVGDLTVTLPPPLHPDIRRGFALAPTNLWSMRNGAAASLGVGPSLDYAIALRDSATGAGVSGAHVQFQQTGGISIEPTSFASVSDIAGAVGFPLHALADGVVTGDLTIQARSTTSVVHALSLSTFNADSTIILERWSVGATGIIYPLAGALTVRR